MNHLYNFLKDLVLILALNDVKQDYTEFQR